MVLEYREKDCSVPLNINRRIQRVMHFQIPLRSFEATVRLPPEDRMHNAQVHQQALASANYHHNSYTSQTRSSKSPRSIPVSPLARKRVQLAFSNFSDDVLYRARDRLRQERAAALSGAQELPIPRFNIHDCNEELYLSCGRHCATKVSPCSWLFDMLRSWYYHHLILFCCCRLELECIEVSEAPFLFLQVATSTLK